jgi:hypothetical protein
VCGISDYGLIKISDLYQNMALSIGEGTKIADVTVAANPYRRTFRQLARPAVLEPIVEFDGTAAHIGVCGPCHLEIPGLRQNTLAVIGLCHL